MRVLADFEGDWQLTREIVPGAGPVARFAGTARWQAAAGGLDYIEVGTLHLPGAAPMRAERRYRWEADLRVYFDDGGFFHQVPAAGGAATHWCDPDTYRVTYDFAAWPCFDTVWDVRGPRKGYAMRTRFARLGAGAAAPGVP
ncbi:MAG: DUF6314 family protein [Pseudomonadota bacterium]